MSENAECAERFLCALFATVVKPISDLRLLISGLCALLFALCSSVHAQQPGKVYRIGILQSASFEATFIEGFRRGLRELGYIEGKNLALEIRWGEMKGDRLSTLAAELVRIKVDILVAAGDPAVRAAKGASGRDSDRHEGRF
jgi:putative tryptophan/tyrosine transport system substrate-binding protein